MKAAALLIFGGVVALAILDRIGAAHLLREAQDEAEALRADLMWSQDAQMGLVEERDTWRAVAQTAQEALIAKSVGAPRTTGGDGGIWLFKDGWCAARGPFSDPQTAREEAEDTSRQYPGDTIHVLCSTENVTCAASEPHWDYPVGGLT